MLNQCLIALLLGYPKPFKMLIFCSVGIFEYIILLMLILYVSKLIRVDAMSVNASGPQN